jgi:hypothetical protein
MVEGTGDEKNNQYRLAVGQATPAEITPVISLKQCKLLQVQQLPYSGRSLLLEG